MKVFLLCVGVLVCAPFVAAVVAFVCVALGLWAVAKAFLRFRKWCRGWFKSVKRAKKVDMLAAVFGRLDAIDRRLAAFQDVEDSWFEQAERQSDREYINNRDRIIDVGQRVELVCERVDKLYECLVSAGGKASKRSVKKR